MSPSFSKTRLSMVCAPTSSSSLLTDSFRYFAASGNLFSRAVMAEEILTDPQKELGFQVIRVPPVKLAHPRHGFRVVLLIVIVNTELVSRPVILGVTLVSFG